MMRCRDVHRLSSAYIDGELDDGRASALRGHLRQCAPCHQRVEDEARLRDAADELEPIDPGPALWAGIEERLAAAEIADAGRSRLWLRWQSWRAYVLPTAVAAVAAVALLSWIDRTTAGPELAGEGSVQAAASAEPGADEPADELLTVRAREVAAADRRYLEAIRDLRELAERERERWTETEAAAFDARVAEFEVQARRNRQGITDVRSGLMAVDPQAHDELYAVYQAQIDYLQRAVLGEDLR